LRVQSACYALIADFFFRKNLNFTGGKQSWNIPPARALAG